MQQNETTLQVVCSNPDLVIENNFSDTFEQSGKLVKEFIYTKFPDEIKQISTADDCSWLIDSKNDLYYTGDFKGGYGAGSGSSSTVIKNFTKKVSDIKMVSCGSGSTTYLTNSGDLYYAGWARSSGIGSDCKTFKKVRTNVKYVSCCVNATWIIDENNDLYGCGYGQYGEQGSNSTPLEILSFTKRAENVKMVACSKYATAYITNDGDLYVCGRGENLGLGVKYDALVKVFTKAASNAQFVSMGDNNIWYIDNDGNLYGAGEPIDGKQGNGSQSAYVSAIVTTFTKRAENVKYVEAGNLSTFYINNDNELWGTGNGAVMGHNDYSTNATRFKKIADNVKLVSCKHYHGFYVTLDNYMYGTGNSTYGLGSNITSRVIVFKDLSRYITEWKDTNNETINLADYGLTLTGTPVVNDKLTLTFTTKVLTPPMETRLTVGTSNESLQVINNYKGTKSEPGIVSCDLTYGLGFDKVQQAKVFDEGICYIDSYGDLYFKGNFKYGSSGDGTIEDVLYEEETKKATNVKKVGGSSVNTFYINKQNELYVCGQNTYGQLGVGTTEDVLEFTKIADNVKDAVLYETLMYITQDNDLYVCGRNDLGQLGIGNTDNISTPHKVAINVDYISADAESTWYISRGELYGTGYNANGKQGSGDTENVLTFTKRAENVKMVAASDDSVQYITNEGELYCAGQTKNNEMFNGVIEEGIYTTFTKCNENIKYLYLGSNIRYYVKDNGNLYVVGNNINGEYGDAQTTPDTPEAGTTPVLVAQDVERAGYCHYYDINGHLFMCGDNTYGQIIKDEPAAQTYSLRRSVSADSLLPWTDVTKTEIGWTNENNEIVNLDDINVEVQGEPEEGDKISLTFNTRRLIPVGLDVAHGDRVGFRFVTAEQYDQLLKDELVTGNLIYAITDGKTLLMGNKPYSINNKFVEEYPKYPAQGVIYFNTTTRGVKMYNGAEWTSLVPDIRTSIDQVELDEDLLTAKAIKDFIDPQINESLVADVTYDNLQNIFTVTSIDGNTKQLPLRNIISSITYENNTFTFNKLGTEDVITLPEENYLIDANFDGRTLHLILKGGAIISVDLLSLLNIFTEAETNSAIATINDDTLQIDVKLSSQNGNGILDVDGLYVPKHLIHSAGNTSSVLLDITDNKLTGDVNISQAEGNCLILNEDGLYTNTVPIDLYYDKIQLDELLDARKDEQEFVQEIDLKIEPHLVYEKEQQYNITEMDEHKGWRAI